MMLRAADDVSRAGASARDGASALAGAGLLHPAAVLGAGPRMARALEPRAAALLDGLTGSGPAVLARAPGRVNLIGEHTDYNGLPVLPIAIDRDVLVAARRRDDDRVELANADPAFAPRRYLVGPDIPASPPGDWANYHKAAARALVAELARRGVAGLPGGTFR